MRVIKKLEQLVDNYRLNTLTIFTLIVLFLAGIGPGKILLSTFVMYALVIISSRLFTKNRLNIWSWFGIILWSLFLLLYYFQYKTPYMPENINGRLDFWFYLLKAIPTLTIFLLIAGTKNEKQQFQYLVSISLGCLAISSINTFVTLLHVQPPYYGKAWEFFSNSIMNSPGTTILSSIASMVFVSYVKLENIKSYLFSLLLVISTTIAVAVNLIFVARSYFFIISTIVILKVFFNFLNHRNRNQKMDTLLARPLVLFITIFSGVAFFFSDYFINIFDRILNGDYAVKYQHTIEYLTLVSDNFFFYPQSFYFRAEQFWFHNFFFDVHRTSGPITALCSFFLLVLIISKIIVNIKNRYQYSRENFIFFCGFFVYLYTSIPWESSEYQMIFIYSAISAIILSSKR